MKKLMTFTTGLLLLCSCDLKEELPTISLADEAKSKMEALVASGDLSTAEYTVEKIVKTDDSDRLGDRKILFSVKAYLEGGIDMSKYDASKTVIIDTAKTIYVTLPKAQLLSLNIPPEEITQKFTEVGFLRSNFSRKECNEIQKQGEADIRADIDNIGIIEDAENNARLFFTSILKQVGYEHVTVKFE